MVAIGYGYVITNVAQLSLGTTAFVAGSLVLPGALVGAVCAPLGGWFYDKFGAVKPILIPIGMAILGPVLMLVFSMQLTPVLLAGFYFIFGLFYFQHVSSVWRRCRYRTVLHDSFRGSGRRRRRRHR